MSDMDEEELQHAVSVVNDLVRQLRGELRLFNGGENEEPSYEHAVDRVLLRIGKEHLIDDDKPYRIHLAEALLEKEGWRILALFGPKGFRRVLQNVDEDLEGVLERRWDMLPSMGLI